MLILLYPSHAETSNTNITSAHCIDALSAWSGTRPVWYPVYDMPLGPPKANATLGSDGVWAREFEFASVRYDTHTETGSIRWTNSSTF